MAPSTFIPFHATGVEDVVVRKRIRSEAMRSIRRQRRVQDTIRYQERLTQRSSPAAADQSGSDSNPQSLAIRRLSEPCRVGVSYVDPFNVTAIHISKAEQALLATHVAHARHCLLPPKINSLAETLTDRWAAYAITDPLVMWSTFAHASNVRDAVARKDQGASTLRFKTLTLRGAQELLSNSDDGATPAAAVYAVIGLAGMAATAGHASELAMHMLALERMMESRRKCDDANDLVLQTSLDMLYTPAAIVAHLSGTNIPGSPLKQNEYSIPANLMSESDLFLAEELSEARRLQSVVNYIQQHGLRPMLDMFRIYQARATLERKLVAIWSALERGPKSHSTEHQVAVCLTLALLTWCLEELKQRDFLEELCGLIARRLLQVLLKVKKKADTELLLDVQLRGLLWATMVVLRLNPRAPEAGPLQQWRLLLQTQLSIIRPDQLVSCLQGYIWESQRPEF